MRATLGRSVSFLTQAANMQSAFASLEVSPRYMRLLSDQARLWSMAEIATLIFTNLMVLVINQIWHKDASLASLFTSIAGLVVLLVVEGAFETIHVLWMVRIHNLPLLCSEDEPGVVKASILTCLLEFVIVTSGFAVLVKFFMLHAVDPDKHADASFVDVCLYFQPYFMFPAFMHFGEHSIDSTAGARHGWVFCFDCFVLVCFVCFVCLSCMCDSELRRPSHGQGHVDFSYQSILLSLHILVVSVSPGKSRLSHLALSVRPM
uniref:Uncharacterized protein n=1 Tax=Vitrella brassicaformis TaxID=1169539 RepID=A0A7S1JX33_9ALVE|mmetsp:Transcript_28377/g.70906  ORF Transcript_28377/g.70906 Transcript_28377/m.70906 type:complete len:262 (+) Transcript_28377:425-1210(+)